MASNGYAWWYLDAVSDDGRYAVVVIAMLGSAFSPYYAAKRSRGPADPLDFVAMNVAIYGPSSRRWALTERASAVRSPDCLVIGPSSIRREGDGIVVDLDEVTSPIASKLRGRIRLEPITVCGTPRQLDAEGAHRWWPIAPSARVSVELSEPDLRWSGQGYFDANAGDEPLEAAFSSWDWSRLQTPRGAVVSYCVRRRDGSTRTHDLEFDHRGAHRLEGLGEVSVAKTRWRLERSVRASESSSVRAVRTLEDAPFYARSLVQLSIGEHSGVAMHESLSLDRFASRWVRALLPMRIRRVRA